MTIEGELRSLLKSKYYNFDNLFHPSDSIFWVANVLWLDLNLFANADSFGLQSLYEFSGKANFENKTNLRLNTLDILIMLLLKWIFFYTFLLLYKINENYQDVFKMILFLEVFDYPWKTIFPSIWNFIFVFWTKTFTFIFNDFLLKFWCWRKKRMLVFHTVHLTMPWNGEPGNFFWKIKKILND